MSAARRSLSRWRTRCRNRNRSGARCCSDSAAEASLSRRSSRRETTRSASRLQFGRSTPRHSSSAVGCTTRRTSSTILRNPCSPRPRRCTYLDGCDQSSGPARLRAARCRLRPQISQGDRVPSVGSRDAARLVRVSGRTLDSHPHEQPHPVHVRHHPAPHRAHQAVSRARRHARSDLQAGHECREELAQPPRLAMARQGAQRSNVRRWD